MEVLLHDAEYLAVRAMLLDDTYDYPHNALDAAWHTLLLNQFHDILPGSSIAPVYADARAQFAEMTASIQAVKAAALDVIARHAAGDWVIINTVDHARNGVVLLPENLPDDCYLTDGQEACLTQSTPEGTLVWTSNIYNLEMVSLHQITGTPPPASNTLIAHPNLLENDFIRATFNNAGHLISLYDKRTHFEILEQGKIGNQFQLFEDRPLRFDAWNIDPDYESRMWTIDAAESIEVVETGPVRATIKFVWRIMHSTITQYLSLYKQADMLEARTHIDWQERNMLLKVAFPVNIRADQATYHIQWGTVKRSTRRSSPWDAAKYEVAAHHWADLGDDLRGVMLVNDCKYAYDIHDNVMRLTLLKGATYPDPQADLGEHELIYRLCLRADHPDAKQGYDLNYPLLAHRAKGGDQSLASIIESDATLETVKRAEDGSGIIFRLYAEHAQVNRVRFNLPVKAVWRVNFMEEKQEELTTLEIPMRQHEIVTLLVII